MKILFMTWVFMLSSTAGLADSNLPDPVDRIADFKEAEKVFAFSSIIRNSLDTFMWIVAHDSYANHTFKYGQRCNLKFDEVYDAERDEDVPSTFYGCHSQAYSADNASQTLFDAYKQTILSTEKLRDKIAGMYMWLVTFRRTSLDEETYNKNTACNTRLKFRQRSGGTTIAGLWKAFHNNYKREHQLYADERRKEIINRHFIAIKRSYGLYASRLRKISQSIERQYDCDRNGPEASPPNVGN